MKWSAGASEVKIKKTLKRRRNGEVVENKEQETVHFPQFPYTAEQFAKGVITPIKKPRATTS